MKITIELESGSKDGLLQQGTHLEEMAGKMLAMVNDHTLYSARVVEPEKDAPVLREVKEDSEWWIKETITYLIRAATEEEAMKIWVADPNDRGGYEASRDVESGFEI